MPKVSAKQVQRRIAELDAQYTVSEAKHPSFVPRVIALTILAIIAAVAAFSANRSTSEFTRITLRKGTAPKPQMSDAEAQAKWDAIWGAATAGLKRGTALPEE